MSEDKQCFFVESPDGRKFKMVIRGDLGRLSVNKIRRYLGNYGVQEDCNLFYRDIPLENNMVGDDFGLENNSVLQIKSSAPNSSIDDDDHHHQGHGPQQQQRQSAAAGGGGARGPSTAAPIRAHDAWAQGHPSGQRPASRDSNNNNNAELIAALDRLEAEKAALEAKVEQLSRTSHSPKRGASTAAGAHGHGDPFQTAEANLRVLAEDLGLPLRFDSSGTCVLNGEGRAKVGLAGDDMESDGLSVFISYDAHTQRVVLYTTLLTRLPFDNPPLLAKLYEVLLEGSLLGREVCGGGIGVSKDGQLAVIQSSFSAIHSNDTVLRDTMPIFVETVRRWRSLINELLS